MYFFKPKCTWFDMDGISVGSVNCLENSPAESPRGFESHPIRHYIW